MSSLPVLEGSLDVVSPLLEAEDPDTAGDVMVVEGLICGVFCTTLKLKEVWQ